MRFYWPEVGYSVIENKSKCNRGLMCVCLDAFLAFVVLDLMGWFEMSQLHATRNGSAALSLTFKELSQLR